VAWRDPPVKTPIVVQEAVQSQRKCTENVR
jgi:hypothetical protein